VLTERDILARRGVEEPTDELVEVAHEELGRLDVLVRHVPPVASGPLLEADRQAWSGFIASTLVEAFEISRTAARLMPQGGSIVHIASIDALHAYPGRSAAAAAMSGLVGLVRSLAVELAALGVRVNLVIPGPIEELVGSVADARRERTELRSPSGRLGTAAEVASGVLFVAGPSASFMTGQALRVDGGWGSLNQAPDRMKFRSPGRNIPGRRPNCRRPIRSTGVDKSDGRSPRGS
jgi:3-oxoacyl-[acyl-carrier protein] reductase